MAPQNMKQKFTNVLLAWQIMATDFWNEKGFILVRFLPRAPAVNSDHMLIY